MRKFLELCLIALSLSLTFNLDAHAGRRDGALELSSSDLYQGRQAGKRVVCGRIEGQWLAGTLAKGSFLTHTQFITNLQAIAKAQAGKKKRTTLSEVRTVRAKARREQTFCSSRSTGGGGTVNAIRFRSMEGAAGLALKGASTTSAISTAESTTSNLYMVAANGALEPVLESGSATISRMLIAPNNKIYVLFQTRVNLEAGYADYTSGCLLAEVSAGGGVPTCVDNELAYVNWPNWGLNQYRNRPIQFDSEGAIYYWGNNSVGTAVLRRYLNGVTESLITDNVYVSDFLVRQDGAVFISGSTNSTQTSWLRHLRVDRSLRTINSTSPAFLSIFPDESLYYGVMSDDFYGIKRFLLSSETVDSNPWTGRWYDGWSTGDQPYYNSNDLDFCQSTNGLPPAYGYCAFNGAQVSALERTTSGKMFAVAVTNQSRSLMQYFPEVNYVSSVVSSPTLIRALLNHLFIAGTDSELTNRLMMMNTDSGDEADLLQGNQIEIYRMGVVNQSLLFDGLNFANNQYVIGAVNLQTLELQFSSTGDSRLVDFETFTE